MNIKGTKKKSQIAAANIFKHQELKKTNGGGHEQFQDINIAYGIHFWL